MIYIYTNLINGKQYVGQTTRTLKQRQGEHKNRTDCPLIHAAIKKYGIENFKIISFFCPEEDLDWTETFLEKELNTIAPNGYNLESGGHKNKHLAEITKQKLSEIRIKSGLSKGSNNPNFGSKKMIGSGNPMFGKPRPEITKQRISETRIKKGLGKGANNPTFGKPRPEITKQRISETRIKNEIAKGGKNPKARPVILISPDNKEYSLLCYKPFCLEHHLTVDRIRRVLQGKQKHYKGWTGKYLEK